jgi:hypothetical protein
MQKFETLNNPLLGFSNGGKKKKKRKKCKIVAYGCQTPSAQRRSHQNHKFSGHRKDPWPV